MYTQAVTCTHKIFTNTHNNGASERESEKKKWETERDRMLHSYECTRNRKAVEVGCSSTNAFSTDVIADDDSRP